MWYVFLVALNIHHFKRAAEIPPLLCSNWDFVQTIDFLTTSTFPLRMPIYRSELADPVVAFCPHRFLICSSWQAERKRQRVLQISAQTTKIKGSGSVRPSDASVNSIPEESTVAKSSAFPHSEETQAISPKMVKHRSIAFPA